MRKQLKKIALICLVLFTTVIFVGNDVKSINGTGNDIKTYLDQQNPPLNPNSIITDFDIEFVGSGSDVGEIDDPIKLSFKFAIPPEIEGQIKAGDYYIFTLPEAITIPAGGLGPYDLNDGTTSYGEVYINEDRTVELVFNQNADDYSNVHGEFYFEGSLDGSELGNAGEHVITVPGEEHLNTTITVTPTASSSIKKEGTYSKTDDPDHIYWDVYFNLGMESVNDPKIVETFPAEVEYVSSELYSVEVDFDGKPIEGSEQAVPSGDYNFDQGTSTLSITNPNPITQAYKVTFKTKIKDDVKPTNGESAVVPVKNEATFSGSNITSENSDATVDLKFNSILGKESKGYDKDTQTMKWEIQYNYNEEKIQQNSAYITDELGNGLVLVEDSIKLYYVTFDENNKPIKGAEIESDKYTITKGADGFTIQFLDDVEYAVLIEYETKVDEIIDENTQYENKVTIGSGNTVTEEGTAYQQGLVKNITNINYNLRVLQWSIEVNKNNYTLHDWKMQDTLSTDLKIAPILPFKVTDVTNNVVLKEGTDYNLVISSDRQSFELEFINDYAVTSSEFLITYYSTFDATNTSNFTNSAVSDWKGEGGEDHSTTQIIPFEPNEAAQNNGKKIGTYDYQTKEITWTAMVNYDNDNLNDAVFTDHILDNQTFVSGSTKIYKVNLDAQGNGTLGDEVVGSDLDEFTIHEPTPPKNDLVVEFPDKSCNILAPCYYAVQFKTSLEGKVIEDQSNYDNYATFQNEGATDEELVANVEINNGGVYGSKTGEQDSDGFADWEIIANPSQSIINNYTIIDKPSIEQKIIEDSIVIYNTTVASNGDITANTSSIVDKSEYTVELVSDSTGQQTLTIKFLNTINKAYSVNYKAFISLDENQSGNVVLTNDITIKGENDIIIDEGYDGSFNVSIYNGGGIAVGTKGQIVFQKVNEEQQPLEDAKFCLYNSTDTLNLMCNTTDANGQVTFSNLVYDNYILREVEPPFGHTMNDQLIDGSMVVRVDANSSAVGITTQVVNQQSLVELMKVGESDNSLQGAKMKLEQKVNSVWNEIRENEEFITDANGHLQIKGLDEGEYRLTEIEAPANYVVDPTPITFELERNQNKQLENTSLGKFTNYQGKVMLKKVDKENKKALNGVIFNLYDSDNILIEENLTTDAKGLIKVDNLKPGKYFFREMETQDQYQIDKSAFTFTIDNQHKGKIPYKEVTVENAKKYDVPKTGASVNEALFILLTSVVLSGGYLLRRNYVK